MSKSTKFFITAIVAGLLFGVGLTALAQEISDISCSIEQSCPTGLECFEFPEVGLRCAQPNPCSYYKCPDGTKCSLAETYPARVICSSLTVAEEPEATETVEQSINLDEEVQPEDLEIPEPKLLPDSPFYFLKNWGRGIRVFFTFDKVKKAELSQKFASEKLIELKKLVAENAKPEVIKKATENYQKELEKIKGIAEKIKEKAEENPKVANFLDKYIQHQVLHQRVLGKLEEQVPPEVFEKIKKAREQHLERFGEVMTKLEDKDKIQARIENNLEKIEGSKYKNFKNLEILLELEEKVPDEAKEAIRKAQENSLKRLKGDLEKMSAEDQEKFKDYLDKIGGDAASQTEILENLKAEIQKLPETPKTLKLIERLEEGKTGLLNNIEKKLEKLNCPLWTPPAPGFCQEGRVVIKKDPETGCPGHPICVIPSEVEIPPKPEEPSVCITLWDPVCGKDGKTYSNSCFAKSAGVEVAYKGACRLKECQTDADCPQLRCGPAGVRCVGVKSQCVEGKCQVQSIEKPIRLNQ